MRLALGQGPCGHGGGGVQADQCQRIVEQAGRSLTHRLQSRRAELVRGTRAEIGHHLGSCLQEGLHLARGTAVHIGRAATILLGQKLDDRARITMQTRRQHKGVVLKLHGQSALIAATTSRALSFGTVKLRTYCWIFQPSPCFITTPEPRT